VEPHTQILNKKARSSDLDLFLFKNLGEVPKPLFLRIKTPFPEEQA